MLLFRLYTHNTTDGRLGVFFDRIAASAPLPPLAVAVDGAGAGAGAPASCFLGAGAPTVGLPLTR